MASDERKWSEQQYAPGVAGAGRFASGRRRGNRAKNQRTAETGVDVAESCGRAGCPDSARAGFIGGCAGTGSEKSANARSLSALGFASLEFFRKNGCGEPQFARPASGGAHRLRPPVRAEVSAEWNRL